MILVSLIKNKMDFTSLREWYCEIPRESNLRPIRFGEDVVDPFTFGKYDKIKFNSSDAFLLFYVRFKDENVIEIFNLVWENSLGVFKNINVIDKVIPEAWYNYEKECWGDVIEKNVSMI